MQNWMFTIFGEGEEAPDIEIPRKWDNVLFAIWQLERCPDTNKLHLQGYLRTEKKVRLSALKKLHPTAHWEKRNGNHQQARAYCSKEETRIDGPWVIGEDGSEPRPGTRTDLNIIKRKIDEGYLEEAIADEHFATWTKCFKAVREYKRLKSLPRTWATETIYLYGPTNVGKTSLAKNMYPRELKHKNWWMPKSNSLSSPVWFDGYEGQPHVVINEFRGEIPVGLFLELLDNCSTTVPVKGGFVNWCPRQCFITSNFHWKNYYPASEWPQIDRRLITVYSDGYNKFLFQ